MPESPVERLMREQLQAMNQLFAQQLEAVRGVAAPPAAAVPKPVASVSPVAPPEVGSVTALPGPLGQGLRNFQRPDNWRINHDWVIKPTTLLHTKTNW